MQEEKLYLIGEVSKICNISKKAFRFYNQIGIIVPDVICKENGHRYYNRETLLAVPIVKYYKQMGFRLEEMQDLVEGDTYYFVKQNSVSKIDELRIQEQEIHNSYVMVKDWYELIQEAQLVSRSKMREVGVEYINIANYCYMDQPFSHHYMESIIDIDWANYLESANSGIAGEVILRFPSWTDKMNGTNTSARIMQRPIHPYMEGTSQTVFGGSMAATVYHLGALEQVEDSYGKIRDWIAARGYKCGSRSYKRYVVNYWTTRNPKELVTEVIVPIVSGPCDRGQRASP